MKNLTPTVADINGTEETTTAEELAALVRGLRALLEAYRTADMNLKSQIQLIALCGGTADALTQPRRQISVTKAESHRPACDANEIAEAVNRARRDERRRIERAYAKSARNKARFSCTVPAAHPGGRGDRASAIEHTLHS
jgi:hypothetical protein